MINFHLVWLHSSVSLSVAPASQGHGFKLHFSHEFFKLLYAIARIVFIAARVIASLDLISTVQYKIQFVYRFVQYE